MADKPVPWGKEADNELFRKAAAGDKDAQQDLITIWLPIFKHVINHYLSRKNKSEFDSDDFTQQLRLKGFRCDLENKHFESLESLVGYFQQIARNEVLPRGSDR